MSWLDDEVDEKYEAEVMGGSAEEFAGAIVGSKIVSVTKEPFSKDYGRSEGLKFVLDNGNVVWLADTDDCCAFTEVEDFKFLGQGEHAITSVTTEDNFQKWYVYAESTPVAEIDVAWSPGNPYYYGFGFEVKVVEKEN